jgi:hypothetical protein
VNYAAEFHSDAQGRLIFPALIPGAPYRILDATAARGGGGPEIRREFTVKPGEALDRADITIARPRGRS